MKHLLVMLIGIIFMTVLVSSCNDGKDAFDCQIIKWESLSADQKSTLQQYGFDTTACYKLTP